MTGFQTGAHGAERTRAEFAKAMASVQEGMKSEDVLKLLGKPDDICKESDGGIVDFVPTEIWCYGTSGHMTFPTLGCVYMQDGKVTEAFGGRKMPEDPPVMDEAELRKILQCIDKASEHEGGMYSMAPSDNPLQIIQLVNTLQPLGKKKAMAAINEYLRVRAYGGNWGLSYISLPLRILFEVPEDPGYMPRTMCLPVPEGKEKLLPRYPVLLLEDVPLNLSFGYAGSGYTTSPRDDIDYFQKNGKWRAHPLVPTDDPLSLLETFEKSPQWIPSAISGADSSNPLLKEFLAHQLLRLIETVYRVETDYRRMRFPENAREFDQQRWDKILKDVSALHIKWDPSKNIYVFADGTSLPQITKPVFLQQVLRIPELGPEALVVISRDDKDFITAELKYAKHKEFPTTDLAVKVYAATGDKQLLVQFDFPPHPDGQEETIWPKMEKLPAGQSVQMEVTCGEKTVKYPVFTP